MLQRILASIPGGVLVQKLKCTELDVLKNAGFAHKCLNPALTEHFVLGRVATPVPAASAPVPVITRRRPTTERCGGGMPGSGATYQLSGLLHSSDSFNRTYLPRFELLRDNHGGYHISVTIKASYDSGQKKTVEVALLFCLLFVCLFVSCALADAASSRLVLCQ